MERRGDWTLEEREKMGLETRERGADLEPIAGSDHDVGSATGLQGFCGVDVLREIRLTPHHRPVFPLVSRS